ncbi:outer membrane beta-barrel protein [Thiothrix nivea]|uniref:Outer membrane protein beta-barrel domain-containing protein n=1 Tax=Thiothrix nivea (strain ATCC 35100 / DSM 5205 / JP2) TaxID=870187 RepID=A0A656HAF1_THINJ|nr:outer membrane beta-barrel protein [Thiothrix nivea]EIJ33072.1 hypothetical protein Thini_0419 [Thiothrix nivea DSM 5205]
MKRLLPCLFSLILLPTAVLAEDIFMTDEEPGQFYAAYSLMKSEAECSYQGAACDSTGWKLLGGYKFNDNLAVEGGYYDIFSNDSLNSTTGAKSVVNGSGLAVSAIGSLPINPVASVSGKVGIMAWEAEGSTNGVTTSMIDGTDVLTGIGLGYKLNGNWQLRGEYEHVGGDLEANMYSAGATFSTL